MQLPPKNFCLLQLPPKEFCLLLLQNQLIMITKSLRSRKYQADLPMMDLTHLSILLTGLRST
jgi:hypothetical protein